MDTTQFPVEKVSWSDAQEFCGKLSELPDEKKMGLSYRLPTEAEWEYACRARTTTPFHFGDLNNGREANVSGNYPYRTTTKGPDLKRTTTVGTYAPNAFGLHDMHGNVSEWCQDSYEEKYYAQRIEQDPRGAARGDNRVFRGGSWGDLAINSRAANRSDHRDYYNYRDLPHKNGFRVVCAFGEMTP